MGNLVKGRDERGLWKNTVVLWMGGFGRTPRINQNGGRDHWGRCWSVVIGGGAIKGGQAYGSTSAHCTDIKEKPLKLRELFATGFKGPRLYPSTPSRGNLRPPPALAPGTPNP